MEDIAKVIENAKTKIKNLSPYLLLFENHLFIIFHPTNDVNSYIEESKKYIKPLKIKGDKKIQFINELWMLRYASLFNWFLNIKPPKNQRDLEDILVLLESATKQVLNRIEKIDYLPVLKKGVVEYNINQLTFNNLKEFDSQFTKRVAEKVPLIVFECTGGILGGEQYDDIVGLISIMIETDKKTFLLGKKNPLTEEERKKIHQEIKRASLNKEDITEVWKDVLNSLN